ncbi:reverse transcriptase domain-containing protein [Paenibacillus taichungensis]|uniref:reverse transcriptase domain-containing protein n=1 Tax=Paenibacillus taichungensis TaxID=484184 RepID=UPI00382F3652
MVQMATKIVMETVFEADFKDFSYGFRSTRSAHDEIRQRAVKKGVYWVVDIDIRGYLDNIPHDSLMQLVEQRISNRRVLKLIRQWLKAGFVEDDEFHKTEIGSPQGGVISPLLANIYLNYLDMIWEKKFTETGTLVRYADDLVILCKTKEQARRAIDVLKAVTRKTGTGDQQGKIESDPPVGSQGRFRLPGDASSKNSEEAENEQRSPCPSQLSKPESDEDNEGAC